MADVIGDDIGTEELYILGKARAAVATAAGNGDTYTAIKAALVGHYPAKIVRVALLDAPPDVVP